MLITVNELRGNPGQTNILVDNYPDELVTSKIEVVQTFLEGVTGLAFEAKTRTVLFDYNTNAELVYLPYAECSSVTEVRKDGHMVDATGARIIGGNAVVLPFKMSGAKFWELDIVQELTDPDLLAQAREALIAVGRMWVREESNVDGPQVIQLSDNGVTARLERATAYYRTGNSRIDSLLMNLELAGRNVYA